MQIANPIYDVVFKYMMEDNAVVKKQMKEEDEIFKYLRDAARIEANKLLKEKDKTIEDQQKRIAELERQLKEQTK